MSDDYKPKERKNWTLSEMAFRALLLQFSVDEETAAERYLFLQKNLIRFFAVRGILNANDATDKVFNRIARKISEGENIENINSYALSVARFVALELIKKQNFEEFTDDIEQTLTYLPKISDEQDELSSRLENCLDELSDENKQLVLDYYEGDSSQKIQKRKIIAEKLGLQQNALTKRITRLREKLEKCLSKFI